MEYTIVHSDLINKEIKPEELLANYIGLLESDIRDKFSGKNLIPFGCPTNGETSVREKFPKMGMTYCVSQSFSNYYISPRPSKKDLMNFYHTSKARQLWLTELWPQTKDVRKQKVIRPQLDWLKTFIQQHINEPLISMAEFYPNQWGYIEEIKESKFNCDYILVEPMFDPGICPVKEVKDNILLDGSAGTQYDAVCLFDALDRSDDPASTMQWVDRHLKPGGLCFVTCLLSSGLEVQVLRDYSRTILPPERMNLFSYEGILKLIENTGSFEILECSTPGVLDIASIQYEMRQEQIAVPPFFRYLFETRNDPKVLEAFQEFLQMNKLSSFGRLVLRKTL